MYSRIFDSGMECRVPARRPAGYRISQAGNVSASFRLVRLIVFFNKSNVHKNNRKHLPKNLDN
ncbi:hypothetical protein C7S15_5778 [Burkholderia cepacia]|nr:hypothetical protein [Burkholderia cepacia]